MSDALTIADLIDQDGNRILIQRTSHTDPPTLWFESTDRNGEYAASMLSVEQVTRVRAALTTWLDERAGRSADSAEVSP